MNIENLIFKMLTENTGQHMLDSGGAYGRNWQRNAKKTLKDFQNEPAASLDLSSNYFDVTLSAFHHLTNTLEIDDYCEKFNRLKCTDWDGDFYGTSASQCRWLEKNDFSENTDRREFNTYNLDSNLSQILQGTFLRQCGYVDDYVLLQIHGGCDVRGGYTDAKLFKIANDYFLYENASFSLNDDNSLDVCGADVNLYNHESGDQRWIVDSDIPELLEMSKGETHFFGDQLF
jgi:hypothetical protein